MTARPGAERDFAPTPEHLASRLQRSTQTSMETAAQLGRALIDKGDVWHAGRLIGVVRCLGALAREAEFIDASLNNYKPKEATGDIRGDTDQDSDNQGQMRLV